MATMKVDFPVQLDGKTIMVSSEVKSQIELFTFIADMQELFGSTTCERNGQSSDHVKLRVRSDDEDNKYYEMFCYKGQSECFGATRRFGCTKKGEGLFPRSRDKDGNYIPNNGWTKYNKVTKTEE